MSVKKPSDSKAILTEIVLPNDTNNLNNLMGGRLLHWMDIAAAITAHRHCNRTCVTAAVNNGWLDYETAMPEALLSIKRAGADVIITYFAKEYARFIKEGIVKL